jgi:hypothetical protein
MRVVFEFEKAPDTIICGCLSEKYDPVSVGVYLIFDIGFDLQIVRRLEILFEKFPHKFFLMVVPNQLAALKRGVYLKPRGRSVFKNVTVNDGGCYHEAIKRKPDLIVFETDRPEIYTVNYRYSGLLTWRQGEFCIKVANVNDTNVVNMPKITNQKPEPF